MGIQPNRPAWWKDEYTSRWERTKEALRRDWEQTKHDLHMGGHEMNQSLADTMKQAQAKEPIPPIDRANRPKVIGDASDWQVEEEAIRYGYGARGYYGARYPRWNDDLVGVLMIEWNNMRGATGRSWDEAKRGVRHGYEFDDRATTRTREQPSQGSPSQR